MVHKTVIELPVSIGDTIYKKRSKVISCQYFGDEYSGPGGQPNCMQHEYDCDACDAVHEYWVEPVIVDAFLLSIC